MLNQMSLSVNGMRNIEEEMSVSDWFMFFISMTATVTKLALFLEVYRCDS